MLFYREILESHFTYKCINIIKNFENTLSNKTQDYTRPSYWGGYSFKPYYFEFWEGHASRINKREVFNMNGNSWKYCILQP